MVIVSVIMTSSVFAQTNVPTLTIEMEPGYNQELGIATFTNFTPRSVVDIDLINYDANIHYWYARTSADSNGEGTVRIIFGDEIGEWAILARNTLGEESIVDITRNLDNSITLDSNKFLKNKVKGFTKQINGIDEKFNVLKDTDYKNLNKVVTVLTGNLNSTTVQSNNNTQIIINLQAINTAQQVQINFLLNILNVTEPINPPP